jgi:hypothetical protein
MKSVRQKVRARNATNSFKHTLSQNLLAIVARTARVSFKFGYAIAK